MFAECLILLDGDSNTCWALTCCNGVLLTQLQYDRTTGMWMAQISYMSDRTLLQGALTTAYIKPAGGSECVISLSTSIHHRLCIHKHVQLWALFKFGA